MMDLRSRVSYLQGLANGMNIAQESKEGQLLHGIIDLLTDFAEEVRELQETHDQMEDYIEALDEDLYQLEDEIFVDDTEFFPEDDFDMEESGEYVEVDCPGCGETVMFDSDILNEAEVVEVSCPNCEEIVFINDDTYFSADEPESLTAGHIDEDL
ncbi:MAG: AraC family transcriptional regulator [Firmicutes bacterium]|nr:AraC family transcriptional regulator [Bacillota bacterium]